MYEEKWKVQASGQLLEVVDPKNNVQRMQLSAIKGIAIQTNDSGPIGMDVIWFISDGNSTISFPMGATGEDTILQVFQKIEEFDNEEFINAMGSTEKNVFILLNKTKA
ncbi:MAG: hypothetical protein H7Y59_02040 [Anaerolineales bacterium]|nr:hypothetical protein [Anaerolineales bacterium]